MQHLFPSPDENVCRPITFLALVVRIPTKRHFLQQPSLNHLQTIPVDLVPRNLICILILGNSTNGTGFETQVSSFVMH
jgi:hypothetical protein